MGFWDWFIKKPKKKISERNRGWIRVDAPKMPRWARDTLFNRVNKSSAKGIAYTKGNHYYYKVVMKPDLNSGKFDFYFYKKKMKK